MCYTLQVEHLLDRRNDENRLLKLNVVPAAGGNHLCTLDRETGEVPCRLLQERGTGSSTSLRRSGAACCDIQWLYEVLDSSE